MSALDEAGADQRLASYVDRILALRQELASPVARLHHCRSRVGPRPLLIKDRPAFSRGVGIASKVLGCDFQTAKILLASEPGTVGYSEAFARVAADCPAAAAGLVYTVECPEHPGVIKIGFTTNLERRLGQLIREYQVELKVIATAVGTYADEYVAQRRLGHLWLCGEWFGSEDNPRFCPDFIRVARGMPVQELREHFMRVCGMSDCTSDNSGPFRTSSEAEAGFVIGQ